MATVVASQQPASTRATISTPPAPSPSLDPVQSGDPAAMKGIEARVPSERTVDEALSLAVGRSSRRRSEVAALGRKLQEGADAAATQQLLRAAREGETYLDAMRVMADLPGPQGPDMIYEVWVGTASRTAASEFAEELVMSKEVRAKASPALAFALDLRAAQTCDDVAKVLPRAAEQGDRRSVHLLGKLSAKRGCGSAKRDDCYPCLRGDKSLDDAIRAARARPAPKF